MIAEMFLMSVVTAFFKFRVQRFFYCLLSSFPFVILNPFTFFVEQLSKKLTTGTGTACGSYRRDKATFDDL
jgi:hypothetical protein